MGISCEKTRNKLRMKSANKCGIFQYFHYLLIRAAVIRLWEGIISPFIASGFPNGAVQFSIG
jgi:hypothetical protein